ncbi:hypothetical protein A3860_14335 [Niastella vici]|uniref:Uncharacterized protein n=1 Tax=Niastella vici TaxID=1703345 RepID=A0A1V9G5D8_9BACT|nr:hypothetical protein A3860_14335 [Niastella vici]
MSKIAGNLFKTQNSEAGSQLNARMEGRLVLSFGFLLRCISGAQGPVMGVLWFHQGITRVFQYPGKGKCFRKYKIKSKNENNSNLLQRVIVIEIATVVF